MCQTLFVGQLGSAEREILCRFFSKTIGKLYKARIRWKIRAKTWLILKQAIFI